MDAFPSAMKTTRHLGLLFATVALMGQLLLRELPDRILVSLNHHASRTVIAQSVARPAAPISSPRPAPLFAFANGGLSPEDIALAGKVVTLSTQNLHARLVASTNVSFSHR